MTSKYWPIAKKSVLYGSDRNLDSRNKRTESATSRRARGFPPIVWSNQRELLEMVRQFRSAVFQSAVAAQTNSPSDEALEWYARSLALADAYIARLARAISERPQGKGGWQVTQQLEKMYAEFAAHHDNPPPGMAVEVEPKTESQSQPEGT